MILNIGARSIHPDLPYPKNGPVKVTDTLKGLHEEVVVGQCDSGASCWVSLVALLWLAILQILFSIML
jgi:hypothetical protein